MIIQNRKSVRIAFERVRLWSFDILIARVVMMKRLNIFRIGNQAKSPLSGTPFEDGPPPLTTHKDTDAPLVTTIHTLQPNIVYL